MDTPAATSTETITPKNIWDVAAEPTEVQTAASNTLNATNVWTVDNTTPAAAKPAEPEKPKYSEEYYKLSGINTAGMVVGVTTMANGGLNHWLMKRKIEKIMPEEEVDILFTKMKTAPATVTDEEKAKIAKINKLFDLEAKIQGAITWTAEEEKVLAESFQTYQKFTGKPLPPWIMIMFCILKKQLTIVNAYIFA